MNRKKRDRKRQVRQNTRGSEDGLNPAQDSLRMKDFSRVDALVRAAFEREVSAIALPSETVKPEYRLMGSAGIDSSAAEAAGPGRTPRIRSRAPRPGFVRQNGAFAFALALFAVIILVPSVLSVNKPGFSEIAAAGIQADRTSEHSELAAWSKIFTEEARKLAH